MTHERAAAFFKLQNQNSEAVAKTSFITDRTTAKGIIVL
jgi:hypothetical protein